jgi:hypothetical protein
VATNSGPGDQPWTPSYDHIADAEYWAGVLYNMEVQTTLQLLVGGKGIPGLQYLIQISCSVTQYFDLVNPYLSAIIPPQGIKLYP